MRIEMLFTSKLFTLELQKLIKLVAETNKVMATNYGTHN